MTRLFTYTISEDKKQSEFEGEIIARISWKCGVCKTTGTYTTNDYSNPFDELNHIKRDELSCKCDPEESIDSRLLQMPVIAK